MLGGFQTDWAVFPVALSFDFVRNEAPVRPQIPAKAGIGGGEDEAVSAEVLFLSPWTPACAGVSGREGDGRGSGLTWRRPLPCGANAPSLGDEAG